MASVCEQLTWEIFQQVLRSMPRGKAVGSGGVSAELIRALGEDAQRDLFHALREDSLSGVLSDDWKRVLYALLPKGYPNDPRKAGDRREIALMAVEMKMLLQMVRKTAYTLITSRLAIMQVGWIAGFGVGDAAIVATALIQQARAVRHPLWLLYIDLSKFFPRIRRDVSKIAGLVRGLPDEVIELVLMIYGAHGQDKASEAVRCILTAPEAWVTDFRIGWGGSWGACWRPTMQKYSWIASWLLYSSRREAYACTAQEADATIGRYGNRFRRLLTQMTGWVRTLPVLQPRWWRPGPCGVCGSLSSA